MGYFWNELFKKVIVNKDYTIIFVYHIDDKTYDIRDHSSWLDFLQSKESDCFFIANPEIDKLFNRCEPVKAEKQRRYFAREFYDADGNSGYKISKVVEDKIDLLPILNLHYLSGSKRTVTILEFEHIREFINSEECAKYYEPNFPDHVKKLKELLG